MSQNGQTHFKSFVLRDFRMNPLFVVGTMASNNLKDHN